MSRDVQYIGMEHKEAIAIAVINDGGKLVMESIIATKGRSILQLREKRLLFLAWRRSAV